MAEYKVILLNQTNQTVDIIDEFLSLQITLVTNDIHQLRLELPGSYDEKKLVEDYRIEVHRDNEPIGQTQFLLQSITWVNDGSGLTTIRVGAAGALKILDWPIVAYNAGTSQAVKSGNADDLIKEIVDENLGASATDTDRDMSTYLTITSDASAGASVQKSFSRRNVLTVCQELADASATAGTRVYFDIVSNANKLELRTYTGQRGTDKSSISLLSPIRHNMSAFQLNKDYNNLINYAYAGGQGQEADRNVQTANDATRVANSVWGRVKEGWRDARHITLTASLVDEADMMVRNGRAQITAQGTFLDTPGHPWGELVEWGDLVKVQFDRGHDSYTAHVNPVTFSVNNGVETIRLGFKIEL